MSEPHASLLLHHQLPIEEDGGGGGGGPEAVILLDIFSDHQAGFAVRAGRESEVSDGGVDGMMVDQF